MLITVLLVIVGTSGCASGRNTVTGRITPAHFEFKTVNKVPEDDEEPGGWQAVCIHARITQGDSGATYVCKFEVGVPLRNESQGDISIEAAQQGSADMANRAIRAVLSEADPTEMLYTLCKEFKTLYRLMLKEKIHGAEVRECKLKGIKTIHFNIPYHCD